MFFNFARFFPQQQQLDSLLTNPDCSLEAILITENILPEIKGMGASKFADFIVKRPAMFESMIKYVIEFEDELIDKKTQIQFPFLSSEILANQNQKLIDFMFDKPEIEFSPEEEQIRANLYNQLIEFLENDVLNVTSAGYFAKAMIAIIKRRGFDVWEKIVDNQKLLSNLLKHIDIKHIAEIVEKLIILDTQQEGVEKRYLDQRKQLLQRVIQLLQHKSYNVDIVDNICDILIEITSKSMSSIYYNNGEILPFIDLIKKPQLLLETALKTQRTGPYQLLINLVEMQSKEVKKEDDEEEVVHNLDKDYSITTNSTELRLLYKQFPQFKLRSHLAVWISSYAAAQINLSSCLVYIYFYIRTNDYNLIKILLNQGLIQALQIIIIRFESNNQIHICCERILKCILEQNVEEFYQDVFESNQLLNFIIANHNRDNKKKGFIGFLTKFANYLIDQSKQNIAINFQLKNNELWETFIEQILNEINAKEKPFLCNADPRPAQENEVLDEAETDNILNILKKFNSNFQAKNAQNQEQSEESKQEKEVIIECKTEILNIGENDVNDVNNELQNEYDEGENQQQEAETEYYEMPAQQVKLDYNDSVFWKIVDLDSKQAQALFDDYE